MAVDGDRHQRAGNAEERAKSKNRQQGDERIDPHRLTHDAWHQHGVFQLLNEELWRR